MSRLEPEVSLREVTPADVAFFFEFERDPEACHRAAFTADDPSDRAAFDAHWSRLLANPAITRRTILLGDRVAGYVAGFERLGQPEVCYWVDRALWGRGIATRALSLLLRELRLRPMFARVAKDNLASMRVLEKNGFEPCGEGRYYSNSRHMEVDECILRLDAARGR